MRVEAAGVQRVLDALKKYKPATVVVTLTDGEKREVSVRGGRSRWTPAARTIVAYGWSRLEFLDAKGTVCGEPLDNGAAAADVEDPEPGSRASRELHLMRLMSTHAHDAVRLHIEALKPTLQAMQAQVAMLAEQLVAERRESARQMEAAADLAEQFARVAARVEEGGDSGGELGQLLQVLPHVLRMMPPAAPRVPPRRPAPSGRAVPPNGKTSEARQAPPADGATT